MNEKCERIWNPEISGGIVFDGDVPIVIVRKTEDGYIMIFIESDENMKVYLL